MALSIPLNVVRQTITGVVRASLLAEWPGDILMSDDRLTTAAPNTR